MRIIPILFIVGVLGGLTIMAYDACFHGVFLPKPLEKPVSLRDGSKRARAVGYGYYFIGGRRHFGGGYGRGK